MINAAKNGLYLWAMQLVPSLLPCMILTGFSTMILHRFISIFPTKVYRIIHKIFALSPFGLYIFIAGQLCGYPLGAKMTADAYKNRQISRSEATYLLTICNQSSPAFLEFYIGDHILDSTIPTAGLFIIFYTSTIITSFFTRKWYKPIFPKDTIGVHSPNEPGKLFQKLDQSITESCQTILRVGCYVMLFSIVGHMILERTENIIQMGCVFTAILEITTGLENLKLYFQDNPLWIFLVFGVTAFGGFSTMAQIKGMLLGTPLSIKSYLVGKIIYTMIVLLLVLFSKFCFFCF